MTRFEAAGLAAYGLLVGVIIVVFFEAYGDLTVFVFAPFFVRAFALSVSSRHINEKIGSRLNRVLVCKSYSRNSYWHTFDCEQNAVVFRLFRWRWASFSTQ